MVAFFGVKFASELFFLHESVAAHFPKALENYVPREYWPKGLGLFNTPHEKLAFKALSVLVLGLLCLQLFFDRRKITACLAAIAAVFIVYGLFVRLRVNGLWPTIIGFQLSLVFELFVKKYLPKVNPRSDS